MLPPKVLLARYAKPHWVYRAFDADGVLLYVGCTSDPWGRFNTHRRESPWFSDVDHVEWDPHANHHTASDAERGAIHLERPLHNVQHNRAIKALGGRHPGDLLREQAS